MSWQEQTQLEQEQAGGDAGIVDHTLVQHRIDGALQLLAHAPDELLGQALRASEVTPRLLESAVRARVGQMSVRDLVRQMRHLMVEEALERCVGNRSAMARLLGLDRAHVRRLLADIGRTDA